MKRKKSFQKKTHYLPHQAVIRSDALTTKLRVVFDVSARVKPGCLSLNDCTYSGSPLTAGIVDILMRFRAHKVGLVADIEKAFLNIEVDKQPRGETPMWNRRECSSEILNLTPKGGHLGVAQGFCDP